MEAYIKKIEEENKRLEEELGRKNALISSTPFNSTLYITFGTDFAFDGTLCGFLARISYAYVNPYTGREEDKHLKRYEQKIAPGVGSKNNIWYISNLLKEVDSDLRDFLNTNLICFKTDPMDRNTPSGIPWMHLNNYETFFVSGLDEEMVFELFRKQRVLSMEKFKRVNRWTRFKQLIKGI